MKRAFRPRRKEASAALPASRTYRKPPLTARAIAYDVLSRAAQSGQFATRVLESRLDAINPAPQERKLAVELVNGVVRRHSTLDLIVRSQLMRSQEDVEEGLMILLQLGAYQLVFLSGIPEHAAVNETVEVAKVWGESRWTAFLNGVLRSISKLASPEWATVPASNHVPTTASSSSDSATHKYRVLNTAVFPDPARDPIGYFTAAFSFPAWLAERWFARVGQDELYRWGFWFNTPSKLCLRSNSMKISRDELLERLQSAGVGAQAGIEPQSIWLDQGAAVSKLPGYSEGLFTVQDESAMSAARRLAPLPGSAVLDLCAAPGGKTVHMAELMRNQGKITACDIDGQRLGLVMDTCNRLGMSIVETWAIPTPTNDLPRGPFNAVMVDVPCSNSGVLGKRPEARWRQQPTDLQELPELQHRLLCTALARTLPGAKVLYSTCSIEPEENRAVVNHALAGFPEWRLVEDVSFVPGAPGDGGYQALLARD